MGDVRERLRAVLADDMVQRIGWRRGAPSTSAEAWTWDAEEAMAREITEDASLLDRLVAAIPEPCYCDPEQPWHDADCPFYFAELDAAWDLLHQLADVLRHAGSHLHDDCKFAMQIKSNLSDYEFFCDEAKARSEARSEPSPNAARPEGDGGKQTFSGDV